MRLLFLFFSLADVALATQIYQRHELAGTLVGVCGILGVLATLLLREPSG